MKNRMMCFKQKCVTAGVLLLFAVPTMYHLNAFGQDESRPDIGDIALASGTDLYRDILDLYAEGDAYGWSSSEYSDHQLYYDFGYSDFSEAKEMGFCFADINADGIVEMFVSDAGTAQERAELAGEYRTPGYFSEFYTYGSDGPVLVERERGKMSYELCKDGRICCHSSGAWNLLDFAYGYLPEHGTVIEYTDFLYCTYDENGEAYWEYKDNTMEERAGWSSSLAQTYQDKAGYAMLDFTSIRDYKYYGSISGDSSDNNSEIIDIPAYNTGDNGSETQAKDTAYANRYSSYQVFLQKGTWGDASEAAIRQGGHLAEIDSMEEFNQITQFLDQNGYRPYRLYIGAFRDSSVNDYYWQNEADKSPVNALNSPQAWCRSLWLSGEPTYYDSGVSAEETVVEMYFSTNENRWVWNDVPYDLIQYMADGSSLGYLCEFSESLSGSEDAYQAYSADDSSYVSDQNSQSNDAPYPLSAEGSAWPEELQVMPDTFVFTSGAGAWSTEITLRPDLSFSGYYHDSDMDCVYYSRFHGSFSTPEKVDDYSYRMQLISLTEESVEGEEHYENGIRYVCSSPYGFEDAGEFMIYLPGAPYAVLPEMFRSWSQIDWEIRETMPSGYYGIYNVGGEKGFTALSKDSFWASSEYTWYYNDVEVCLWPSSTGKCILNFLNGYDQYPAEYQLYFTWPTDADTQFKASDVDTGEEYDLSIIVSEDNQTVSLELRGSGSINFDRWGGNGSTLNITMNRSE